MIERIGVLLTARRMMGKVAIVERSKGGSIGVVIGISFGWLRMRNHFGNEIHIKSSDVVGVAFGPDAERDFERMCAEVARRTAASGDDDDDDDDRSAGQLSADFIERFMRGEG